jgi:predicted DNA-binding protein
MANTPITSFRLSPETRSRLDAIAAKQRRSLGQILNAAAESYANADDAGMIDAAGIVRLSEQNALRTPTRPTAKALKRKA